MRNAMTRFASRIFALALLIGLRWISLGMGSQLSPELRTAISLARLWRHQGKRAAARACEDVESGGDLVRGHHPFDLSTFDGLPQGHGRHGVRRTIQHRIEQDIDVQEYLLHRYLRSRYS